MKFRTEIDTPARPVYGITHNDRIVMLGSCFTDNIGKQLIADGFDVIHNPLGTLYNPLSILRAMRLAMGEEKPLIVLDNRPEAEKAWHCLDMSTRYSDNSRHDLLKRVISDLEDLGRALSRADILIVTLGTAFVYQWEGTETVGNCHKLPSSCFTRRRMSVEEIEQSLAEIAELVPQAHKVIFTVSPVRHTADGLHANNLSKASLMLGIDRLADNDRICYFPAYEILCDDLRDYRFYAPDLKHPSDSAVEYIYDIFEAYSYDAATRARARDARRRFLRSQHRPIID